jgi:hypothetical protein
MTDTLVNVALTVLPFVIIGVAVKLLMRRKGVDLSDVQSKAGSNRRPRKVFLLGFWRDEE